MTALRLKTLSDRLNDPTGPFQVAQKAFRADHAVRTGRQFLCQIPWDTGWYVSEDPAFIARIRMGTGLRFGVRACQAEYNVRGYAPLSGGHDLGLWRHRLQPGLYRLNGAVIALQIGFTVHNHIRIRQLS